MKWEFTANEVVRGEVVYGLEDFRRDLMDEVSNNLESDDEVFIQHGFDVIYELCHWIATGRKFADFVNTLPENGPFDVVVLQTIKDHMTDNITMLGAILQRMIMDGVEQGMAVEQAVDRTAQIHDSVVSGAATN